MPLVEVALKIVLNPMLEHSTTTMADNDDDGGGYGIGFYGKTLIDLNLCQPVYRLRKSGKVYGDGDDLDGGYQNSGFKSKKFVKIKGKLN
ncbi:hypothetical protein LguiB_008088 [Lonicera macranthoides]